MITRRSGLLCSAFLGALLLACSGRIDESKIDAEGLCRIADAAFAKQDLGELLEALETQFHVKRKEMRTTEQGVYVPVNHWFVEEQGYFLMRPGAMVILRVGDPAFVRVRGCIFRYRIKG